MVQWQGPGLTQRPRVCSSGTCLPRFLSSLQVAAVPRYYRRQGTTGREVSAETSLTKGYALNAVVSGGIVSLTGQSRGNKGPKTGVRPVSYDPIQGHRAKREASAGEDSGTCREHAHEPIASVFPHPELAAPSRRQTYCTQRGGGGYKGGLPCIVRKFLQPLEKNKLDLGVSN